MPRLRGEVPGGRAPALRGSEPADDGGDHRPGRARREDRLPEVQGEAQGRDGADGDLFPGGSLMGSFRREGTFQNRDRFLEGVKQKLEKLMGGAAQGMTSTW